MKWNRLTFLPVLALTVTVPVRGQVPDTLPEHVGRVVAVVGDSVITNWDLQERLLAYLTETQQQMPPAGPELDRLTRDLLDDRINELLLLQAAVRDTSLTVSEQQLQQINQQIDAYLARLRQQLGGEAALEAALRNEGRTLSAFREGLLDQQRRSLLVEAFRRKEFGKRKPPPVTDAEVQEVFTRGSAQVGTRPATVTFDQVVLPVSFSDTALARAKTLADSIFGLLQGKEDFDALAKRFSHDTSSAVLGGDLGWFRRGAGLIREFEDVAFSPYLRPGMVTEPILTAFGYHIIRVDRVRGAERQIRHILIRPTAAPDDVDRARETAEQVVERLRNGASVAELVRQYGDPDEESHVGPVVRDSLPAPYHEALQTAAEGDVIGPLPLESGPLRKWAVIKIARVEQSRPATLEDYQEQIRQRLAQQKLMEEILQEIRRRTHVEIRLAGDPPGG